jgi:hypothetical protein
MVMGWRAGVEAAPVLKVSHHRTMGNGRPLQLALEVGAGHPVKRNLAAEANILCNCDQGVDNPAFRS